MNQSVSNLGHVMLALETMGTVSRSPILRIAAIEFDMVSGKTGRQFNGMINLQSCFDAGLIAQPKTIAWWLEQNEQARFGAITAIRDGGNLSEVLDEFTLFLRNLGHDFLLWGDSPRFDIALLHDAYHALGKEIPWNFRNERDVRTLTGFAPEIKANAEFHGDPHNLIDDCLHQIRCCVKTWNKIFPSRTPAT